RVSLSALQSILEAIRIELTARRLVGVFATVTPAQIDLTTGDDLRGGDTRLRLLVVTGMVTQLRTLASGDRIAAEERINHPVHQRIRDRSPIRPAGAADGDRRDLVNKPALDAYLLRLSRHPNRRVEAALSSSRTPGGVTLDYLVAEGNPLQLYVQASNTGTEQTGDWRQRFGLVRSHLTDRDDLLSLDFITSAFDETNAFIGSYETRAGDDDRERWRVFGSWNEYTASDLGFPGRNFTGSSWDAGGEYILNVLQSNAWFVDLLAGARWQHVDVDNQVVLVSGAADFVLPQIGLRAERTTDEAVTRGLVRLEWQPGWVSVDDQDLNSLGRLFPDDDWLTLQWDLGHSFYLEPVLDPAAWQDPTTAESSTLAHEVALAFRGQYAFNDARLIPQSEGVAGGFYSVRGYPQSVAAGDTLLTGTVEYRYHLPRDFAIQPEPAQTPLFGQAFRWAPQHVYGRPDWDLVLRGFVDVAHVINNDRLSFETDDTLVGAGIGVELLIGGFQVRVDWGFALHDLQDESVTAGSSQIHLLGSFFF
ncbi:MAG: hypothetical protein KJO43_05110, partial [Phycisphaerae bacterium]|nr:hypothetical protein [Phycisphaerae bacterium]